MSRIAVVLSGCGVFDGSEIHEACAALLALKRAGAEVVICAPRGDQMHVIDHAAGEPGADQVRDILTESARIARGEIVDLAAVAVTDVDAVLLPGGFGAAKNLCDFAVKGADCTVRPDLETFLRDAHAAGKPIAAMCIAPVILARVFGRDLQPRLTIGTDPDTAAAIGSLGAVHEDCAATGVVVDPDNRILTTPAYMLAGGIDEVFDGAAALVAALQEMLD
jgi:enhancing lycopene biosynthesis protein 2